MGSCVKNAINGSQDDNTKNELDKIDEVGTVLLEGLENNPE
jgi:hypothetical protein